MVSRAERPGIIVIGRAWQWAVVVWVVAAPVYAGEPISFDRQIRSLLSNKCFACHGPDESSRKGGLRLDIAEPGQTAIAPGDPGASEALRRITATDPADRMPPPEAGDPLTAEEAALIEAWIAQGAPRSQHWAFQTPGRPEPPAVDGGWVRNPIDAFILARLEREGLTPSPEADRLTLLRRLSLINRPTFR